MKIQKFPSEVREWAKMESRLEAKGVTLKKIRNIEDALLLKDQVAEGLFGRIAEKRKRLIDREVVRLSAKTDIGSKIKRFVLLSDDLSPEERDAEVFGLMQDVKFEEKEQARSAAQEQLEEIRFMAAQPIVHDLVDTPLTSNFVSRMRCIAKAMLKTHSLIPFLQGLNVVQQKEVMRCAKGGSR